MDDIIRAAVWGEKSPEEPQWNKWLHINLSDNHCDTCLKLNECWFEKNKTPKWPHHLFCHCLLKDISYNDVLTNCSSASAYSKFDPYLFNTQQNYSHNKEKLFKQWGYTVSDAKWLQKEIEKQGLEKYVSGKYSLNKLSRNGQQINIRIEIPRKNKSETVSFITGWMVFPNGHIQLITPYGGK